MIRRLTKADKDIFMRMSEEFYSSDAVLHNVPEEYHTRLFNELIRSDEYTYAYIFECDNRAVGYALLAKKYSREAGGIELWLEEFYVMPEYRGKGFGKEFLNLFSEADVARLRLETEPDNLRAQALYRSFGFYPLEYQQFIK